MMLGYGCFCIYLKGEKNKSYMHELVKRRRVEDMYAILAARDTSSSI